MDITIIGTGYVGLVTGAALASLGNRVVCFDTDMGKVTALQSGRMPFFEPGLSELVRSAVANEHLLFTTDLSQALRDASFVFLCVGTPPKENGSADLSAIETAARAIGLALNHDIYLVTKSTVPVGTNRHLRAIVEEALEEVGRSAKQVHVTVLSNPEFLREGTAVEDFMKPDRIVVGADEQWGADILLQLYAPFECSKIVVSLESAELAKYAANAFLATKISFVNEIAEVAERTGADIREIVQCIGQDPRIGSAFLRAGIGYGGSCFPKDVSALAQIAGSSGVDFRLLAATIEVNRRQRERFVARVRETLGELTGKTLAVWGLAFKANTDDVRESASVDIIARLYAEGADVVVFDPQAMPHAERVLGASVSYASSPLEAVAGVEALCILTEWPMFRAVSLERLATLMRGKDIFDGRNLLADMNMTPYGLRYHGVGLGGVAQTEE
ncbi:UDP-glucose/GDP-mannose dehydrogenase family protein [Candidatus Uhrbacteria bacterium]|nr:UDP-glucose/GDP-mannose dehydrogenase family protein [Candidatus Uhrbacteria bacterium]